MFKMGGGQSVGGNDCPFVLEHADLRFAHIYHGLDGEGHAWSEDRSCASFAEVGDLGFFVEMAADAVSHEFADYRVAVSDCLFFDVGTDITKVAAGVDALNGAVEDLF